MKKIILALLITVITSQSVALSAKAPYAVQPVPFPEIPPFITMDEFEKNTVKTKYTTKKWLETIERQFNSIDDEYICEIKMISEPSEGVPVTSYEIELNHIENEEESFSILLNIHIPEKDEKYIALHFICFIDDYYRSVYSCQKMMEQLPWTCLYMINGKTYLDKTYDEYDKIMECMVKYWSCEDFEDWYQWINPKGKILTMYYISPHENMSNGAIYIFAQLPVQDFQ